MEPNQTPDPSVPSSAEVAAVLEEEETSSNGASAAPKKPHRPYRFRLSLKMGLAGTILVTVLMTAALIFFPWYLVSRKNTANIAKELNREIIKGIAQEINNVFTNAETTLQTIDGVFSQRVVSLEDKGQREKLYLSLLKSNPTFSWISFGWPNGDFMGAQRQDNGNIRYVDSVWDPKTKKARREITYYKSENNRLVPTVKRVLENKYYSPQRSWFKDAVDKQGVIWTGVYVFSTSKKPGINTALSYDIGNKSLGVITIAIELNRISNYLASIKVGKTGTVFIMSINHDLIAFQDPDEVTHTLIGKEKPQLKRLDKAQDPRLVIAYNALKENDLTGSAIKSQRQIYHTDKKNGEPYYISFAPIEQRGWVVGTVIPENDFMAEIHANIQTMGLGVIGLLIIAAVVVVLLSRHFIVNPLLKITAQTHQIQNFQLEQIEYSPSIIREVDQLSTSMDQMRIGLDSFQKYLPTQLVRTLISEGIEAKVGGEEKALTVFFMDLVGFTKLSEAMGAKLIPYLGEYMGEMSTLITDERGTIDKYIGDAIMAFWGAPTPSESHAVDACRAAVQCQRALNSRHLKWKREGKVPFAARIGINTGPMLVGNMGSEQKMDYTVIGDAVNVASRLEALNKMYGTSIMIGEDTYREVSQEVIVRKLDTVVVYGREKGLSIYEVIIMRENMRMSTKLDWIQVYEEGLELYGVRKFASAVEKFMKTIELRGGQDQPSELLIRRCNRYISKSPDATFSGTTVLRNK